MGFVIFDVKNNKYLVFNKNKEYVEPIKIEYHTTKLNVLLNNLANFKINKVKSVKKNNNNQTKTKRQKTYKKKIIEWELSSFNYINFRF